MDLRARACRRRAGAKIPVDRSAGAGVGGMRLEGGQGEGRRGDRPSMLAESL